LIAEAFPDLKRATHVHAVATLRVAIRESIDTFILLREPIQAVSSYLLLHQFDTDDYGRIDSALLDYIDYYSFVEERLCHFDIVPFESVTERPTSFLRYISERLSVELNPAYENVSSIVKSANTEFEREESKWSAHNTTMQNAFKAMRKKEYYPSVRKSGHFDPALRIYSILLNSSKI